jgi:hypothetical protein
MHSTLAWWIAGPILGLVIVALLGLANKRFGVAGGVTDLVHGSTAGEGRASGGHCSCLGSSSVALTEQLTSAGTRAKRWKATIAQIASTTPNGHVPARKP